MNKKTKAKIQLKFQKMEIFLLLIQPKFIKIKTRILN